MEGNIATDPSRLKGLILLDRDGVINVDHGYVHRPEDTQWLPETLEFGALASRAGFGLVIVTNQAGIGRAYYSDAQFQAYMRWMHGELARSGVDILRTYYCPHHPCAAVPDYRVVCDCRKPGSGMLRAAMLDLAMQPSRCMMIGDRDTDMQAARAAGIKGLMWDAPSLAGGATERAAEWMESVAQDTLAIRRVASSAHMPATRDPHAGE